MLHFEKVWQEIPPRVREELKHLWMQSNVIANAEEADKRAGQAVFVVRSDDGVLAGVSTAVHQKVKLLNDNFLYEFRCFIPDRYRVAGLDVKLSRITFDLLEQEAKKEKENTIGIFSVLENDALKKEPVWQRAVWPEIDMYFIGYTKEDHPVRVHYFKDARI